jgi:hypothetical protein
MMGPHNPQPPGVLGQLFPTNPTAPSFDQVIRNTRVVYRAARIIVVFAVLALVTAGCAGSTGGAPTTPSSAEAAAPWDPCTQIPDSLITNAGLDPTTKDPNAAGAQYEGWKTCSWKPLGYTPTGPDSYYVSILSTNTKSINDIRNSSEETQLTNVTIGNRTALQSRYGHDNDSQYTCDLNFATAAHGLVNLNVGGSVLTRFSTPICDIARQTAISLLPALPIQ